MGVRVTANGFTVRVRLVVAASYVPSSARDNHKVVVPIPVVVIEPVVVSIVATLRFVLL